MRVGLLCVVKGGEGIVEKHAQTDQFRDLLPLREVLVLQALSQFFAGLVCHPEQANREACHQRGEDLVKLLEVVKVVENKSSLCVWL